MYMYIPVNSIANSTHIQLCLHDTTRSVTGRRSEYIHTYNSAYKTQWQVADQSTYTHTTLPIQDPVTGCRSEYIYTLSTRPSDRSPIRVHTYTHTTLPTRPSDRSPVRVHTHIQLCLQDPVTGRRSEYIHTYIQLCLQDPVTGRRSEYINTYNSAYKTQWQVAGQST